MKWEDQLVGWKFKVLTDHNSLRWLKSQPDLSRRQARWLEYIGRFDFEIEYIPGSTNAIADALSRRYESDGPEEARRAYEYVDADKRLDPEGDDTPGIPAFSVGAEDAPRRSSRLREKRELQARHSEPVTPEQPVTSEAGVGTLIDLSDGAAEGLEKSVETAGESPGATPKVDLHEQDKEIIACMRQAYEGDKYFGRIWKRPEEHREFEICDDLIYFGPKKLLCVPEAMFGDRRVAELVIDGGHRALGHLGDDRTLTYLRQWYWWPTMGREVQEFCKSCGACQMTKKSTQKPQGLLHTLPVPTRPWGSIGIDFMGPFPESSGLDFLMVVICRLTSMVHLIPMKKTAKASDVADLLIWEVVRLHGLPDSIVSDRDAKFTSTMWREIHRTLGIKLLMSTAFHPQTDGATERANRTIAQILRALISSDQTDWMQKLAMVELAINSSVSASTSFAPFELNYGWIPRLIAVGDKPSPYEGVRDWVDNATRNLERAFDAIIAARIVQRDTANNARRQDDPLLEVGSKAYLSTENLALPKGRAEKLAPKYIGPYTIVGRDAGKSTYTLELPKELKRRRIHPTFHARLLRPYYPNNDKLFPNREALKYYDFGADPEREWRIEEILNHKWERGKVRLQVRWSGGDTTWVSLAKCEEAEALDRYLELRGVKSAEELPA